MTYLLLAAPVVLAGYLLTCAWWPLAACFRCRGDGKLRSPTGKSWRRCTRCKGSGERLRVGRLLWNRWCGVRNAGARRS